MGPAGGHVRMGSTQTAQIAWRDISVEVRVSDLQDAERTVRRATPPERQVVAGTVAERLNQLYPLVVAGRATREAVGEFQASLCLWVMLRQAAKAEAERR